MTRTEYKLVLGVLKKALKAKKYTYSKLAEKIGVSEATIRRIFAGYECNIGRLFDICEVLGISFLEIVQFALQEQIASFFLSKKQEEHFAKNPRDYGFFRELYYGKSLKQVCKEWELTEGQAFTRLLKLERLGLLTLGPGNEFRFQVTGQMNWSDTGPMVRELLRARCEDLLAQIFKDIPNKNTCFQTAEVELTQEELEGLIADLNVLAAKYCKASAKTRQV